MSFTPVMRPAARIADQRRQVEHLVSAARTRARAPVRGRSPAMLVRNPTRPKFTPRQGMPVPSQRWSARSIVPSPPSTTTMSGSCSSTISTPQRAATARSRVERIADDLGAGRGSGRPRAPPPRRHDAASARSIWSATSAVWSSDRGCAGDARYTMYSRFPAGPGTQESHTPRTAQPLPVANSVKSCNTLRRTLRVADDAPADVGAARPRTAASRARAPARIGAAQASTAGSTRRSEMNDTSAVTRVGPERQRSRSPATARSSRRCTVTRGSARRRSWSWFRPTSSATTAAAPCWSRQSVNPPVEAPTSRHRSPATSDAERRPAPSRASPRRATRTAAARSARRPRPRPSACRPSSPARRSRGRGPP